MTAMHPRNPPSRHVLLVEEDEEIRDIYTTLFESQGFDVSAASSACEALDHARHTPVAAVFSSLVFRDMGGFDLCRQLRAMPDTADSLIVALTGYSESGIEEKVKEAGFDAYLLKPVRLQTLLALVEPAR
jgi:CheY-like chemotaxis protein